VKIDAPREVRQGEELDLARLADWLRAQHLPWQPLSQQQFPRGHSNLTYLVRAGDQELVLRRPPFGSTVKSAHDMGREGRILQKLHPVFPLAPRVVALCDDTSVLGAPFYLMAPIRGAILRGAQPKDPISPEQMAALCRSFVQTLAALHGVNWKAAGLEGKPEGFARRQVDGWTKRWNDAKSEEVPAADEIARWLAERVPAQTAAAFIHNDYKFDNLVLAPDDPTRIVGVLDWEMATAGDPLMDLGTALGYWVEETDPEPLKAFAFGPTFQPGAFTRKQVIEEYARLTGRDVSHVDFYTVLAAYKLAVIIEGIHARFLAGETVGEGFEGYDARAAHLVNRALMLANESSDPKLRGA
jgi:aminoglycoside phosphotransferase (APT) family kinase protein